MGFEASLRFAGADPHDPAATRAALAAYGFEAPTPLTAPVDGALLVVADTSGLHFRGVARPGRRRTQLLRGPGRQSVASSTS